MGRKGSIGTSMQIVHLTKAQKKQKYEHAKEQRKKNPPLGKGWLAEQLEYNRKHPLNQ